MVYMNERKRLDISIDSEIVIRMREASVKRYKNNRSLSRLIEDLFKVYEEYREPEELKAQRATYDEWCNENEKGIIRLSKFMCNTCYATFEVRPTDGWCCPACHSSDLKSTSVHPDLFERQWWRFYMKKRNKKIIVLSKIICNLY